MARRVIAQYADPQFRSQHPVLRESEYLFGRSSQSTRKRISKALKQALLKAAPLTGGITMHKLRYLWAMKWLRENKEYDEGVRILLLKKRLGHKNLSTPQKYLDYLPSDETI